MKDGQKTCAQRIARSMRSHMANVREILDTGQLDGEEQSIFDYGLCFDEVEAGVLGNKRSYWRWQFSWGGPQEEIRFYDDGPCFVFLDWDGVTERKLTGRAWETARLALDVFRAAGYLARTKEKP